LRIFREILALHRPRFARLLGARARIARLRVFLPRQTHGKNRCEPIRAPRENAFPLRGRWREHRERRMRWTPVPPAGEKMNNAAPRLHLISQPYGCQLPLKGKPRRSVLVEAPGGAAKRRRAFPLVGKVARRTKSGETDEGRFSYLRSNKKPLAFPLRGRWTGASAPGRMRCSPPKRALLLFRLRAGRGTKVHLISLVGILPPRQLPLKGKPRRSVLVEAPGGAAKRRRAFPREGEAFRFI